MQYLRQLAVMEVIYSNLDNEQISKDPDEDPKIPPLRQGLAWCLAPPEHLKFSTRLGR